MRKNIVTLLILTSLFGCTQTEKAEKVVTPTAVKKDSTVAVPRTKEKLVAVTSPDDNQEHHKESLPYEFQKAQLFDLKDTLQEDFNGDRTIDKAVFLTEDGKAGIIITDGKTQEQVKIGLGNKFEEQGDDFSWVDYWGIVKDSSTYEIIVTNGEIIGDTLIRLENPAIVVRKEEVGGGLITFRNGKYEWIHQAD